MRPSQWEATLVEEAIKMRGLIPFIVMAVTVAVIAIINPSIPTHHQAAVVQLGK
jgi:hypothetical protein